MLEVTRYFWLIGCIYIYIYICVCVYIDTETLEYSSRFKIVQFLFMTVALVNSLCFQMWKLNSHFREIQMDFIYRGCKSDKSQFQNLI